MATKYTNIKTKISKSKPLLTVGEIMRKSGNSKSIRYDKRLTKFYKRVHRLLEQVYGYKDIQMIVTRGYVTAAQNEKDGGATNSKHLKGEALDHYFTGIKNGKRVDVPSIIVAGCYQINDCMGVERINSRAVHIDTRSSRWFANKKGNDYPTVTSFFGTSKYWSGNNKRPTIKYKGEKYEIYGYRVTGNKYRVFMSGKLKWVTI